MNIKNTIRILTIEFMRNNRNHMGWRGYSVVKSTVYSFRVSRFNFH